MTPDTNRGFSGTRTAFTRRSRQMTSMPGFAPTRRNTVGHGLFNELVEWWPLCEVQPGGASQSLCIGAQAGTLFSGTTVVPIVPGNGPTMAQAFGGIGTACIHRTTDAALAFTTAKAYTVAAWVYPTSTASTFFIYSQYIGTSAAAVAFGYTATGALFYISNNATFDQVTSALTLTVNTWNLVVGWYDPAAVVVAVSVNNSAATTAAAPNAPLASVIATCLGGCATSSFTGNTMAGRLQRVGLWKRVLTAGEISFLYNGGFGRDYPFSV